MNACGGIMIQGNTFFQSVGGVANNGVSVDTVTGSVVLGQDVGAAGNPAVFLSPREIPNGGFDLNLLGTGDFMVTQVAGVSTGEAIQADRGIFIMNGFGGNIRLRPNAVSNLLIQNAAAPVRVEGPNNFTEWRANDVVTQMTNTGFFDVQSAGSVSRVRVLQNGHMMVNNTVDNGNTVQVNGSLSTADNTAILHATVNMLNGAAAAAGTLNNAPAAGNPTKWIPFDDNGTTRYIPSW